jgi:3-deoxy-7-phosphoheptulonate synthase
MVARLHEDRTSSLDNSRVIQVEQMISPRELIDRYSLTPQIWQFVEMSRKITSDIINLNDPRLLVITWPCSIHNVDEALEYAEFLRKIKDENPHLFLVMRTYFEKPRTTVWWKGLINDPYLDDSCDIEEGLRRSRELLLKINEMWIPTAVEFLDTITPQYFADLVTWWAIWARTTESQEHRKLVSWLSMPVWFKNWTTWDIQIAVDAIWAANWSHSFIWVTKDWNAALIRTKWNPDWHVILRWWSTWPNYDEKSISEVIWKLDKAWIHNWIIIDASHANSNKNHNNQPKVSMDVTKQISNWNRRIVWIMIEWNLNPWNQKFTPWETDISTLKPWVSITDACVDLGTNNNMIQELNNAVWIRNSL